MFQWAVVLVLQAVTLLVLVLVNTTHANTPAKVAKVVVNTTASTKIKKVFMLLDGMKIFLASYIGKTYLQNG